MKVVLVRHPPPDIAAGTCYGRLDVALTPAARDGLALRAADPSLLGAIWVWTSPARRCRELGWIIAERLRAGLTIDQRLQELDFGDWEGRNWNDVPRGALAQWAASPGGVAPQGGETGTALIQRVSSFFSDICDHSQDCVVVSHGGPLKILIALVSGTPVDLFAAPPPIGSVTVLETGR